jgi:hypothetical protein
MTRYIMLAGAMLLACNAGPAAAQTAAHPGAVVLSGHGVVPQNPSPPKLNLTDAQRETIRDAVRAEPTEIEFKLKTTKAAADANPKIGDKLPKGVTAHAVPQTLRSQLPQLADYKYAKMKDTVFIVNPMNDRIVDMFPETRPPG